MFRSLKIYKLLEHCNYMKILREKSREYKGKPYYKYKINIPEEILKESELDAGDDLEIKTEKHKLILKKIKKSSENS